MAMESFIVPLQEIDRVERLPKVISKTSENAVHSISATENGMRFCDQRKSGICDEVRMVLTTPERRSLARFPLELSVKIQISGTDAVIFAETKNISAGGIYICTASQIELGTYLHLILTLPPELTQNAVPIDIACSARVLRIDDRLPDGKTGIAAEIHSYDFLAQAAAR